jgi:hypothetical protein
VLTKSLSPGIEGQGTTNNEPESECEEVWGCMFLPFPLLFLQLISRNPGHCEHRNQSRLSNLHGAYAQALCVRQTLHLCFSLNILILFFWTRSLSPCGHVLCLCCLQEWFRKAPPGDDEMDNEDPNDPDYLIYRRKSCPVCRGEIKHRPVPVFMVKSIVSALTKVKDGVPAKQSPPIDSDTDVWAGLFPDVNDESDEDGDDEDDDDEDDEDDDGDDGDITEYSDDNDYSDDEVFSYGSDSDAGSYAGRYVSPCWEPPSVCFDPTSEPYAHLGMGVGEFAMYRRGATLSMITKYQMRYSHNEGLVAHLGEYIIYLGWNVHISADDPHGEKFMHWVMEDIFRNPHRWSIQRDGARWKASRLVREDEQDFYSTTDSGEWDFREDFL